MTDFDGLHPWRPDTEIIECHGTPAGTVDLHNDCDLTAVSLELDRRTPASSTLQLTFRDREQPDMGYVLRFEGVTLLSSSPSTPPPHDLALFHALDFHAVEERILIHLDDQVLDVHARRVHFSVLKPTRLGPS